MTSIWLHSNLPTWLAVARGGPRSVPTTAIFFFLSFFSMLYQFVVGVEMEFGDYFLLYIKYNGRSATLNYRTPFPQSEKWKPAASCRIASPWPRLKKEENGLYFWAWALWLACHPICLLGLFWGSCGFLTYGLKGCFNHLLYVGPRQSQQLPAQFDHHGRFSSKKLIY